MSSAPSSQVRSASQLSITELLKTLTTVYPCEMQPPARSGFTTTLKHYQKQSLAFMVNAETNHKRGGLLCDEVGMGKVRKNNSVCLIQNGLV